MISESKVKKLGNWIRNQGGEILPSTNQYEVLRAKTNKGTLVVYTNKSKTSFKPSDKKLFDSLHKSMCSGKGNKDLSGRKVKNRPKGKKKLLMIRDGNCCFYCGERMCYESMTVEHLLSIVHGGSNRLENLVLAHRRCNGLAGDLSVFEKVQLREKMRSE